MNVYSSELISRGGGGGAHFADVGKNYSCKYLIIVGESNLLLTTMTFD